MLKRNLTIKEKLITSYILVIILIISMSITFNYCFREWNRYRANSEFELISDNIEDRLDDAQAEIEWVAKTISYSTTIQTYLQSTEPSKVIELDASTLEVMRVTMEISPNLKNITIFTYNNRMVQYVQMPEMLKEIRIRYGFQDSITLDKPFFSNVLYKNNDTNGTPYIYYFFPVYNILPAYISSYSSETNFAVCAVLWDISSVTNSMVKNSSIDGTLAFAGDNIISINREASPDEQSAILSAPVGRSRATIKGQTYLINVREMNIPGVRFVCVVSENSLTKEFAPFMQIGLVLLVLPSGLVLLLMSLFVRTITRPVQQIIDDMKGISMQQSGVHVRVPKNTDIAHLAAGINNMLDRISAHNREAMLYQQKIYQVKIDQQKAEHLSFRSQINLHFFFNTLECIRSMAQTYHVECIESLCTSMAGMFRYSLHSGPIVTLKDELRHTGDYFNVMILRSQGLYKLKLDIAQEATNHPIHTMVLQPIVENSITHGFTNRRRPYIVLIRGVLDEDGSLLLKIFDNGAGLSPEEVDGINNRIEESSIFAPESEESIGIININRRLKHTFGDKYTMCIRSRQGFYTVVELVIPKELRYWDGGMPK
jgi:two-component system sensor histidine kinase YesM